MRASAWRTLCREGKVDVPHLDGRVLRVPLKEVGVLKRLTGNFTCVFVVNHLLQACNMIT